MSIQADCRGAVHRLARTGGVFTEFDVANEASNPGWNGKHFEQAVAKAYNVLQDEYSKGKLVRYGPVNYKGVEDYARRGTKIIYSDPDLGPKTLATPNGNWPRLFSKSDHLARVGRRSGTKRDDTKAWADQDMTGSHQDKGPPVDSGPLLREIERLRAELKRKEAAPANGNGSVAVAIDDLADLLAERVTEEVAQRVDKRWDERIEKLAEALIS